MEINFLAVLVAAIVSMIIGSMWYSPLLFGNIWMKLSGVKMPQNKEKHQKMMLTGYGIGLLTSVVAAYVMAHFVVITEATDAAAGAQLGFWIWLGFIATTQFGPVIWERRSPKLFFIGTSNMLVTSLAMGIILAVWPA
ncbi:MAG: hypothetical protein ACI9QC_000626 [Oceanicoccus sp.]|jgi:hypothetical protein